MHAIESKIASLKKASKNWNIPFTFLSSHLGGKIRNRKLGFIGVLTKEKYKVIIVWILVMQEVGLSITLQ